MSFYSLIFDPYTGFVNKSGPYIGLIPKKYLVPKDTKDFWLTSSRLGDMPTCLHTSDVGRCIDLANPYSQTYTKGIYTVYIDVYETQTIVEIIHSCPSKNDSPSKKCIEHQDDPFIINPDFILQIIKHEVIRRGSVDTFTGVGIGAGASGADASDDCFVKPKKSTHTWSCSCWLKQDESCGRTSAIVWIGLRPTLIMVVFMYSISNIFIYSYLYLYFDIIL